MLRLLSIAMSGSFLFGLSLTLGVRKWANTFGCQRGPESGRHVHREPVPRLGGIAIFISVTAVLLLLCRFGLCTSTVVKSLIPIGAAFIVGLLDDLLDLRARTKLLSQTLCALTFFFVGLGLPVPLVHGSLASFASLFLTIAWTVLLMNAVNLVDGLDGLASGSAICSAGALIVACLHFNDKDSAFLTAILIGALLGFLRWNLAPASIFLGDSGSLTVGAALSVITIRLVQISPLCGIVGVLALSHPLSEVMLSIVRRAITAKRIFRADRRHLHHRLLDRDYSQGRSSAILVGLSALFAAAAALALAGGLFIALATVLSVILAWYSLQAFDYDEFRYLAALPRKLLNYRFNIDAHVQLKELSASLEFCRHIRELEAVLGETFFELGFAGLELQVVDSGYSTAIGSTRGMEWKFPLSHHGESIGYLRLQWDLSAPPPLELDIFQAEFIPVLQRTVVSLLVSTEHGNVNVEARKFGPVLVASSSARTRNSGPNYWSPIQS